MIRSISRVLWVLLVLLPLAFVFVSPASAGSEKGPTTHVASYWPAAPGATASPAAVNLGSAGDFVILAKAGVTTVGVTSIVGDVGVSPIAASSITGFSLILDSSNTFSTSALVSGKVYAADYAAPTPSKMTTAISDMETAYTDAAGRTSPDFTELGAGDISGMTLSPGLYKWGTGVLITSGVTLMGSENDVWIFQIAQDLTVGNGAIVSLSGGAQAKNIFWQVAGETTLGTTSDFKGSILSKTLIAMNTGATLDGRALAQTAVTLQANAVTLPTSQALPNVPSVSALGMLVLAAGLVTVGLVVGARKQRGAHKI